MCSFFKHMLIMLLIPFSLFSQVKIHPMVVYIDPILRSGQFTINNPTDAEKEVEVSLRYGYIKYDTLGQAYMCFDDSLTAKKCALDNYVSIFPKKIVIKPNDEQIVRFMLKNINKLEDGVYWSRIITSSMDPAEQVDSVEEGKVAVGLNLKIEMITPLIYQKGNVKTNINISNFRTQKDSANINLLVNFERSGNSPAFGTCYLKIIDVHGKEVVNTNERLSIYFNSLKGFSFPKNKFKKGRYKAIVKYTSEQPDTPENYKLDFGPFTKTFQFEI